MSSKKIRDTQLISLLKDNVWLFINLMGNIRLTNIDLRTDTITDLISNTEKLAFKICSLTGDIDSNILFMHSCRKFCDIISLNSTLKEKVAIISI